MEHCNYRYLAVLDLEATCWPGRQNRYAHEIIEFPTVMVDLASTRVVAQLQQFVRPRFCPRLSAFCRDLTGITQEEVDGGVDFLTALERHWRFVQQFPDSVLLTVGNWDLAFMLPLDCGRYGVRPRGYYLRWIDLRRAFADVMQCQELSLKRMLEALGLEFAGRPHRGIDDCLNTAAVCCELLRRGWQPRLTHFLEPKPTPTSPAPAPPHQLSPPGPMAFLRLPPVEPPTLHLPPLHNLGALPLPCPVGALSRPEDCVHNVHQKYSPKGAEIQVR